MNTHNIEIKKTARYYTLGELDTNTKSVFLVVHGYGERASDFIKQFQPLVNLGHFVIAPEGLSRFYWKGFTGKAVASWMTSEDRENEMNDYIYYLETLMCQILKKYPKIDLNVVGFSQGTATLCRWYANTKFEAKNLVLFANIIPQDVHTEAFKTKFNDTNTIIAVGNEDPYCGDSVVKRALRLMKRAKLNYEYITFEGGHVVNVPTVLQLLEND